MSSVDQDTVKVPPGDMAVQCPCFLVLNSNGWADFLPNPVLPFDTLNSFKIGGCRRSRINLMKIEIQDSFLQMIKHVFLSIKQANGTRKPKFY